MLLSKAKTLTKRKISKTLAVSLTLLIIVSSLTMLVVKPANAQAIPTPSVPQFTVKFVKWAYFVPFDPGPVPVVSFTFKNPPFTPYTDQNGTKIDLNYLIDCKRPADNTWIQYPFLLSGLDNITHSVGMYIDVPEISSQAGGQLEFKVAAQISYLPEGSNVTEIGETSGWSSIQTITIPSSSSSPTTTPTAISSLIFILGVSLVVVLVVIAIILMIFRRHRKTANLKPFKSPTG